MAYNLGYAPSSYDLDKQRDSFVVPRISISQLLEKNPEKQNDAPIRGTWTKSIQSLFLCISMSVGLGNVWRFPNIAYNNGGGAFLIPYLLLLFIIGRPLYYLELILGQFSSQGPVKVWRCVPALKGVGYAEVISLSFVMIFYNYLMALSIYYIFASMQSCLPWTACNFPNGTFDENGIAQGIAPSEHYWLTEVLGESDSSAPLSISWKLVMCLLLTWIIVYACVVQGTSSLGKMSYFTAFFPYFVLTALLIVACLEEGAWEGIKFFFRPDIAKLKDINVWYKACEQSFFSLTVAYGNIIMIASYNKFHNNVYRDAIIISVMDTLTNILAGCVIFAVLGTLSHKYSKDIREVVNHEGLGLAFVVYPEALANIIYVPQLWSILFFFMLFILGVGSSMSMIETLLTVIKDQFPKLRERKWLLALCVCTMFFIFGLPLTTNVGQVILVLLNNYGAGAAIFLYAILEVIGITWIYGLKNFCRDVEFMLNKTPGLFWKITWSFTAPVALTVIFIYGNIESTSEGQNSAIPEWASITGWVLAAFALIQIPLWFIVAVYKDRSDNIVKKFRNVLKPSDNWGPSDPVHYAAWQTFKNSIELQKNSVNLISNKSAAYENNSYKEEVF